MSIFDRYDYEGIRLGLVELPADHRQPAAGGLAATAAEKPEVNLNRMVLQFGSVEKCMKVMQQIIPVYQGTDPFEAVEHLFSELGLPSEVRAM